MNPLAISFGKGAVSDRMLNGDSTRNDADEHAPVTRLTNGFSKKVENHESAIALHFMYYNFCRIHQTLRVTPAMEAGVSDHVWSLDELIELV